MHTLLFSSGENEKQHSKQNRNTRQKSERSGRGDLLCIFTQSLEHVILVIANLNDLTTTNVLQTNLVPAHDRKKNKSESLNVTEPTTSRKDANRIAGGEVWAQTGM